MKNAMRNPTTLSTPAASVHFLELYVEIHENTWKYMKIYENCIFLSKAPKICTLIS